MKFTPPVPVRDTQCSHIVQPGEFTIDAWDNKRCEEKRHVVECLICEHSMTHT